MKKNFFVLLLVATSLSIFPQNSFAQTISPEKIRQTGIKTTTEIVAMGHQEELYYDLGLTENQEAKVRLEILDPIYADPERRPTTTLGSYLLDPNIFSILGRIDFDLWNGEAYDLFKTNGKRKETIGETWLQFDRTSISKTGPIGPVSVENKFMAGGKEGIVDEFYVRKTGDRNSKEKMYLKFDSLWVYLTTLKHPPETANKFRFKITIEKSGNRFANFRCKYLKFLPRFLNDCTSFEIVNDDVAGYDPNCIDPHDEGKSYSVSNASIKLGKDLATPDPGSLKKSDPGGYSTHIGSFNKFKCTDANNHYIPQKARDMYKVSTNWNPEKYPDDYVECVTFVFMSYNMAGKPITKIGGTNGKNMVDDKYTGVNGQFTKYKNGETEVLPQKGDVFVWTDGGYGHVGVVSYLLDEQIYMQNANTPKIQYRFKYYSKDKKVFIISDKSESRSAPQYWLHKK